MSIYLRRAPLTPDEKLLRACTVVPAGLTNDIIAMYNMQIMKKPLPLLPFRCLLILLMVLPVLPLSAQIWWTGTGDGSTWEDADNWSGSVVPGIEDIVWLGYADSEGTGVADVAQSINVGSALSVAQIQIFSEGNRTVSLDGATLTFATGNLAVDNRPIVFHAGASAAATIGNDLEINRRNVIENNSGRELVLQAPVLPAPEGNPGWNTGGYEFRYASDAASPLRFGGSEAYTVSQLSLDATGATGADRVIMDNPLAVLPSIVFGNDGQTLEIRQNTTISNYRVNNSAVTAYIERGGSGDYTIASTGSALLGDTGNKLEILPGDVGQGHLTLQMSRIGGGENNDPAKFYGVGPEIVTAADSTVELILNSAVTRRTGLFADDNAGISGDGNVRLAMNTSAQEYMVFRAMTYTGRTMIDTGTLLLNSAGPEVWATGQLPTATIAEIGENGTLDLNGINQQVGGLSDYQSTSGAVLLGGATLTIHSQSASSFSGSISESGSIVKTGGETFTLQGNFSTGGERFVTVQNGVFAITGELALSEGDFELDGGRVTAGSLSAPGVGLSLLLAPSVADSRLFDVSTADITNATVNLTLLDEYSPGIGTEFTLVYASDSIIGADATNMFGYTDGESIFIGGHEFLINWVTGSEAIVLTAIPEPAAMAVLAGLAGLLVTMILRRRR